MTVTTFSSREFNHDAGRAKKAANRVTVVSPVDYLKELQAPY